MSQYIKNILETRGWKEVEAMINETIAESSNLKTIEDNLGNEVVAREARVRAEVYKRLSALLSKIKLAGQERDNKDVNYK